MGYNMVILKIRWFILEMYYTNVGISMPYPIFTPTFCLQKIVEGQAVGAAESQGQAQQHQLHTQWHQNAVIPALEFP
jgi:hypothetical protein